ncbi:GAF domain-containing protein [Rufibacter ruber]|uniref:GAF domain-containing protein n=1 Tax=Rufibacter ruber TaxID=1783499 RepID=UPI00082D9483|nr:GAF domain-containing protein [Rufibacter ruber]
MDEQRRLQELYEYKILDTPPEKELDELAQIASAICDTPISLLTFIDKNRQWFKAEMGMGFKETSREDSFCRHTLHHPTEVLVVEDPLHDERFRENPLVLGGTHIRFYAGAPLVTPSGHVLGTLCILDNKPRRITESQKKALQLLAKKAIDYLEIRKLVVAQGTAIGSNAERLKKLTDCVPGAIYQFEMNPQGKFSFPFISKGVQDIHPSLSPEKLMAHPDLIFTVIHPEDITFVRQSIHETFSNPQLWQSEFRVMGESGKTLWISASSQPEKKEDGTVVWHGIFRDVTDKKEYTQVLEQILFDISHVMRRPVANMLGITSAILENNMEGATLQEYMGHLKKVSEEMDTFLKKLNQDYSAIQAKSKGPA